MTKRTTYREGIPRCQAITNKKQRCKRDATAAHNGWNYCAKHHEMAIAKRVLAVEIAHGEFPRKVVSKRGHLVAVFSHPDPDTETLI
jgi:hypothetical protein